MLIYIYAQVADEFTYNLFEGALYFISAVTITYSFRLYEFCHLLLHILQTNETGDIIKKVKELIWITLLALNFDWGKFYMGDTQNPRILYSGTLMDFIQSVALI
jgi:hypothetical protein